MSVENAEQSTTDISLEEVDKIQTVVNITDGSSANGLGNRHVSTSTPGGGDGSNGDVWYKV